MAMRLTTADLQELATTIDKIGEVRLNVREVEVRGHKVLIERTDSQMDGFTYYVVGITSGELSGPAGKASRDARQPDMSHLAGGQKRGGGFR